MDKATVCSSPHSFKDTCHLLLTEAELLELEAEAFVSLCGEPKSQERMQHMLMKNKPLRN